MKTVCSRSRLVQMNTQIKSQHRRVESGAIHRQDVGTLDCRRSQHNAIRIAFTWIAFIVHTNSRIDTVGSAIGMAAPIRESALKWKNDMVYNSLIIFLSNIHLIITVLIVLFSVENELETRGTPGAIWVAPALRCAKMRKLGLIFRFKF